MQNCILTMLLEAPAKHSRFSAVKFKVPHWSLAFILTITFFQAIKQQFIRIMPTKIPHPLLCTEMLLMPGSWVSYSPPPHTF